MINTLDIRQLAQRIERLQLVSTHGWHPADELEFKNQLPGGRGSRSLPTPVALCAMTPKEAWAKWRLWVGRVLHLEGLKSSNRPGSMKRTIRDLRSGKIPIRFR